MVHWLAWPGLAWSCLFLSCLAAPPSSPFPALRHPPMDDENRFSLPSGCHTTRDGPHGSPISAVGWSELRGAHGWADGRVVCLCIAGETGPRGGDGMHWVSLSCHMFLVLGSRPQSTTAAAQQTTGDVTRSPGPTDRPANAASSQAKGDAARETWCLSMPSEAPWRTSPVLASEFQNRRGFPPQASAFCLKPSPRQSVSQPAETERNEPLLPSAAPPNSNVSGSQPSARLSTTCLRYIAAPVCPK